MLFTFSSTVNYNIYIKPHLLTKHVISNLYYCSKIWKSE